MFNNKPPNRNNTAYIGSFQHALATEANYATELQRITAEANAAVDAAYTQGQLVGYDAGRAAAIEEANVVIRQQLEFTAMHAEEKKRLQIKIDHQTKLLQEAASLTSIYVEQEQALRQTIKQLRQKIVALQQGSGTLSEYRSLPEN